MSASLPATARMTVEQYFDWAPAQPKGRYELVDGVPFRMSPEKNVHVFVKSAAHLAFREAVRAAKLDLVVLPDGPTIVIDKFRSREPDLVIHPRSGIDLNAVTLGKPLILVEVTSPTTMRIDTDDKLIEYFSLSSVQHYILIHPSRRTVVHHRRGDKGQITTSIVSGGSLQLVPPGFAVEVARFFEDLPEAETA